MKIKEKVGQPIRISFPFVTRESNMMYCVHVAAAREDNFMVIVVLLQEFTCLSLSSARTSLSFAMMSAMMSLTPFCTSAAVFRPAGSASCASLPLPRRVSANLLEMLPFHYFLRHNLW